MVSKSFTLNSVSSLYIHIPFCIKKCDYCDFFSIPCAGHQVLERKIIPDNYIDALITEAEYYRHYYHIIQWKTIYIGGGTPSLLEPEQLSRLLDGIAGPKTNLCTQNCEISMELNPDDVTEYLLDAAAEAGVNRLSVGVQSLNDSALTAVNRRCSKKTTLEGLSLISKKWPYQFSCDLIAGLPKENWKSYFDGIDIVLSFPVNHISLYTLTIEENTILGQSVNSGKLKWSAEKADRMWISGRNVLEKKGLYQYEVSNFARPGFESSHNTTYWELENYIGCGAGATSSWYGTFTSSGCSDGRRWTNTISVNDYIRYWLDLKDDKKKQFHIPIPCTEEVLKGKTQEFEYLMMGFRMRKGVSSYLFQKRFGTSLNKRVGGDNGIFSQWEKRCLSEKIKMPDGDVRYALTRKGILYLNEFLEELI